MVQYKFFSKVGIEPTFLTNQKIPKRYVYAKTSSSWDNLLESATEALDTYKDRNYTEIKKLHPWLAGGHDDDGIWEVPSNQQYSTLEGLMKAYSLLRNAMKDEFDFVESTVADIEAEGGCHINIDLRSAFIGKDTRFYQLFAENLISFYNKYPSIAWVCQTPNDTISCKIILKTGVHFRGTCKGLVINFRNEADFYEDWKCEYVEMRSFMMPRNEDEMRFQLILADKIVRHVFEATEKGERWERVNSESALRQYTYHRAKAEAVFVMNLLNIDHTEAKRLGKFQLMQEKIRRGKNYLV